MPARVSTAFCLALSLVSGAWAQPAASKRAPPEAAEPAPFIPPEPAPPLLGYCAPPVRPDCVDKASSYATPKDMAACKASMDGYVRFVFSYRVCLNAEMERAVRETNETIARYKCRATKKKNCP